MSDFPSLKEFILTTSSQVPISGFLLNILFAAILALILSLYYIKYGKSLSNRKTFSNIFVPLAIITTLIISVIKSSLALSLGLVGALSIIRFRTAIKEPEELIYLFLCISIGLGFGADQGKITIIAFFLFLLIVYTLDKLFNKNIDIENLHVTISSESPSITILEELTNYLNEDCNEVVLKRMDESEKYFEASTWFAISS